MKPVAIMVILGLVVFVPAVVTWAWVDVRRNSGGGRKARKAEALRIIETVNRRGFTEDLGTVRIDPAKIPPRRRMEWP